MVKVDTAGTVKVFDSIVKLLFSLIEKKEFIQSLFGSILNDVGLEVHLLGLHFDQQRTSLVLEDAF